MVTKPIRFVQIAATTDHIFGLDEEGQVFYRDKPPFFTNTTNYNHATGGYQKKDEAEEKRLWKKCLMRYKYEVPKGGDEREAQSADDTENLAETTVEVVVDEPPHKVYKDQDTVKKVQAALKEKGFYKKEGNDTYKIDGELGNLTTTAIKAFQKSVSLKETGEIDLNLWNALGLNASNDIEQIIELTDNDVEENNVEPPAFYSM